MASPEPSPRFLLVDGHSIIHAWEELKKLHLTGSKRYLAREMLLAKMRLLQDMSGESVVVVFDGTQSRLTEEREEGGIQIFYADAGRTADSIIERLAAKYAGTYPLRICTADGMIWETVTALGATWISPKDLRFELERSEKDMRKRLKRS